MAIHAAIELLADRSPDAWLAKIRAGESHLRRRLRARRASIWCFNRRYEDGIAYYRKAIELDPQLWSARSELGINLMRLGQEDEPRQQLEMCYDNGYRNEATVNSLRLLDSYKNFVTFKDDTTILKLNKKEADLLHPYFEEVLKRAIATYEKKYKMTLPGPVQVEVYPDHEDFAVRTTGHAGSRRAGRHVRRSGGHGQPLGPHARRFQLGQHAVARDEPRLHSHRHESSRAALVHRRSRGA